MKNYEECVAKKQIEPENLRIDELPMQQERNLTTVSQLFTQIQDLQNKVNSLADVRFLKNLETASGSRASDVPSQPLNF